MKSLFALHRVADLAARYSVVDVISQLIVEPIHATVRHLAAKVAWRVPKPNQKIIK